VSTLQRLEELRVPVGLVSNAAPAANASARLAEASQREWERLTGPPAAPR